MGSFRFWGNTTARLTPGIVSNRKERAASCRAHLDVRGTVGGQVDVEAVAVVVTALLLVDQDHPVVLHRLARLNDGTHGRQGRHVPLHVAARVVHGGLDQGTVVLYVQDAECHLIVRVYVRVKGKKKGRSVRNCTSL